MLQLDSINLVQFRNYPQARFIFEERVVGISGRNGTGKTNLLDAIYYLSFSKSYFSRPDGQNVHHGMAGLRLDGHYQLNGTQHHLVCILRESNRKEVILDEESYKKFSDHIGRFPCVMIAPDDVSLVSAGGEERRKFIDTILSQVNTDYLRHLIDYNKILQQRNSLLKRELESGQKDESLMQVFNEQLCTCGNYLFHERLDFLNGFLPLARSIYLRIAGKEDGLQMRYESQLITDDFAALLKATRQKDAILQRTTTGIHRDDLVFMMGNATFRSEASQGQRKSLLFALKLAEWQTLKSKKGFDPILLLDDVFEKLDEQRMFQLLHWVCTETAGPVFITDTHTERLRNNLGGIGVAYQLIELDNF